MFCCEHFKYDTDTNLHSQSILKKYKGKFHRLEKLFQDKVSKKNKKGHPELTIYREDDELPKLPNFALCDNHVVEENMRGDFLDMSACRIFYAAKEHYEHFITKRYWTPLSLTDDVLDLYMTSYYMETNNVGGGKKMVSNEENEYKRDLFKKYMVQFPTFCIFDIIDTDDSIEDDAHQDPQRYEVIAALTLEQDVKLYKDEQQFSIIHFGAVQEGSKYSSHFMTLLYKVVKNFKLQRYPMIYVTSPGRLRYDDNNNEDQLPYNKLLNYSFRPKKVDTLLQDLLEIKSEVIVDQGVSVDINFKNKIRQT